MPTSGAIAGYDPRTLRVLMRVAPGGVAPSAGAPSGRATFFGAPAAAAAAPKGGSADGGGGGGAEHKPAVAAAAAARLLSTTPLGHAGPCLKLLLIESASVLVSAGLDGRVRVWDPRSGALKRDLVGHAKGAFALAYSEVTVRSPWMRQQHATVPMRRNATAHGATRGEGAIGRCAYAETRQHTARLAATTIGRRGRCRAAATINRCLLIRCRAVILLDISSPSPGRSYRCGWDSARVGVCEFE